MAMRFSMAVAFFLSTLSCFAQVDSPPYGAEPHLDKGFRPAPRQSTKKLTPDEIKTFNEMKAEIKAAYEELLKEEIKKAPRRRKELKKEFNEAYANRVLALGQAYKQGKIELVRKWKSPSMVGTIPSGYGTGWGQIFLGGALSFRTRYSRTKDWNIAGGFGILSPAKSVGITFTGVVDSVTSAGGDDVVGNLRFRGRLLDRGGLNIKISRWLWNGACSVGISRDHVLHWGMDAESRHYLNATDMTLSCIYARAPMNRFANTFMATVGVGNRTFQSYERWSEERKNGLGYFGGLGVRIYRPFSAFVESRRYEINVGASWAPFPKFPWTLNLAVLNVTKKSADNRPLVFSGVLSHSF